jgi:hypothetical protein
MQEIVYFKGEDFDDDELEEAGRSQSWMLRPAPFAKTTAGGRGATRRSFPLVGGFL